MDKNSYIPFGGNETQVPEIDKARIVILPIAYENAPSYGTGSGSGPYHILDASIQLESIDEETLLDWSSLKIHTLAPLGLSGDPEKAVKVMRNTAADILSNGLFLLSIGGDHAISIGPIMAAAKVYPDIGVLQVDAHLDLREEWNGSKYNHACVMRRVAEDIKIPFVQVGIRSFSKAEAEYVKRHNLKPVFAHDIDPGNHKWIERVINGLPEKVYLTIDLDGLDPSVLPGTGTPEPGGLSYRQLVDLIKTVGQKRRVVAADITELAKINGSHVSEFTAAKLATKIFVYCL